MEDERKVSAEQVLNKLKEELSLSLNDVLLSKEARWVFGYVLNLINTYETEGTEDE